MKRVFLINLIVLLVSFTFASAEEITIGYEFTYGSYEQDANANNGKEPIDWIVVSIDQSNDTMTVLSKYCLDVEVYNKKTKETAWKNSHMREWLNEVFYVAAFTPAEQQMILETEVDKSKDHVFLLNSKQVDALLEDKLCFATAFAKQRGIFVGQSTGTSSWWVRESKTSSKATYVGSKGEIRSKNNKVTATDNGIRPAMVMPLSYLTEDTPGADLANLQANARITVDSFGIVKITGVEVLDRIGYFKPQQTGSNNGDFQNCYESGNEAQFILMKMSITNQTDYPVNYLQNVSVVLTFDDAYQYGGWKYQYNHDNGTSTRTYVNEADCGRQNQNYVIDPSDNFAIAPGVTGYYCFGCTVPNAIVEMDAPLTMTVTIDGHEIVHNIR